MARDRRSLAHREQSLLSVSLGFMGFGSLSVKGVSRMSYPSAEARCERDPLLHIPKRKQCFLKNEI